MPGVMLESRIVRAWKQLWGRPDLVTEEDGPVRVVYPGRINDDRGADLRDAVILTRRGLARGDIEVHVKSSSWREHGHHLDPSYNRVVLHVVYRHDAVSPAVLENGHAVPTLSLQKYLPVTKSAAPPGECLPCRRPGAGDIIEILDTAGEARFRRQVAGFREELGRAAAGEVLYRGIMGALGYSRNKQPMFELARRLPLQTLEKVDNAGISDDDYLAGCQSRLLGAAGWLHSPSRAGDTTGVRGAWMSRLARLWAAGGATEVMSAGDWCLFKVRPGNHPARRLAAMSHLLLRYRGPGLLVGLLGRIGGGPAGDSDTGLEEALVVNGEAVGPAWLGRERAAAIVVNVLLPFGAARGGAMSALAAAIFGRHPRLEENTLERHMSGQFGIGRRLVDSARRQQGLVHIYKKYCSQGRCRECPAGE